MKTPKLYKTQESRNYKTSTYPGNCRQKNYLKSIKTLKDTQNDMDDVEEPTPEEPKQEEPTSPSHDFETKEYGNLKKALNSSNKAIFLETITPTELNLPNDICSSEEYKYLQETNPKALDETEDKLAKIHHETPTDIAVFKELNSNEFKRRDLNYVIPCLKQDYAQTLSDYKPVISFYCDGGWINLKQFNSTMGAWGYVTVKDNEIINTTCEIIDMENSDLVELMAIYQVCNSILYNYHTLKNTPIIIYTDQLRLLKGISELVLDTNSINNQEKGDDSNLYTIWRVIKETYNKHGLITFSKVRSHSNIYHNLCDSICSLRISQYIVEKTLKLKNNRKHIYLEKLERSKLSGNPSPLDTENLGISNINSNPEEIECNEENIDSTNNTQGETQPKASLKKIPFDLKGVNKPVVSWKYVQGVCWVNGTRKEIINKLPSTVLSVASSNPYPITINPDETKYIPCNALVTCDNPEAILALSVNSALKRRNITLKDGSKQCYSDLGNFKSMGMVLTNNGKKPITIQKNLIIGDLRVYTPVDAKYKLI